jgi:hypothetical protein
MGDESLGVRFPEGGETTFSHSVQNGCVPQPLQLGNKASFTAVKRSRRHYYVVPKISCNSNPFFSNISHMTWKIHTHTHTHTHTRTSTQYIFLICLHWLIDWFIHSFIDSILHHYSFTSKEIVKSSVWSPFEFLLRVKAKCSIVSEEHITSTFKVNELFQVDAEMKA